MTQPVTLPAAFAGKKVELRANTGPRQRLAGFATGIFSLFAVLTISALVFSNTWWCYFLGDDFIHIGFLADVFERHRELLPRMFFACFLDPTFELLWRPVVEYSMALDYCLWKGNAFGYHLTNVLLHSYCALMLYMVSRRLLAGSGKKQALLIAFFAACAFAAFPLHCEVVDWAIGRVDSLCTAFFLTGLWLFMKARQDGCRIAGGLSLFACLLGLLSKETGVVLPFAIALYCFIERQGNVSVKLKDAAKSSMGFFIVLGGYLLARYFVLGTCVGGYVGSAGEVLDRDLLWRWLNPESLCRVFNPINLELMPPTHPLLVSLHALYLLCGLTVLLKSAFLPWGKNATNTLCFACGWLLLSLVPVGKIWHLTASLIGGRYLYLGSAAACLILPVLLFGSKSNEESGHSCFWSRMARALALAVMSGFVVVFGAITLENNKGWILAGEEVLDIQRAIEVTARRISGERKIVVVDLPQNRSGAHQFYNFHMVQALVRPPLCGNDLSCRQAALEPRNYVGGNLLNSSRLRRLLQSPDKYALFAWDSESATLRPLVAPSAFPFAQVAGVRRFDLVDSHGESVQQYRLSFSKPQSLTSLEFVDVEVAAAPLKDDGAGRTEAAGIGLPSASTPPTVTLCWKEKPPGTFDPASMMAQDLAHDGKAHVYRFCVGQQRKWMAAAPVSSLSIFINPHGRQACLLNIALRDGQSEIPRLCPADALSAEGNDGVVPVLDRPVKFSFSVSSIAGACKAILESSRPHCRFVHYAGTYRECGLSNQSLWRRVLPGGAGECVLKASDFPSSAYYQIRLAAVAEDGKVLGYMSDPLTLRVRNKIPAGRALSVYEVDKQ